MDTNGRQQTMEIDSSTNKHEIKEPSNITKTER